MKRLKYMVLILVMFLLADTAFAQKKEIITGKVVDSISGKPMFGVSVLALNNKGGVVTKVDGSFSLEVKKNTSTLVFSFVGFSILLFLRLFNVNKCTVEIFKRVNKII